MKTIEVEVINRLGLHARPAGTVLKMSADGTDEESALQQLKELFDTKFGEQD